MTTQRTPKTSVFEYRSCDRCDGTGYVEGFSHVMGGVCFKCGSRGYTHTKRGAAAHAKFIELISRPACSLQPGDFVWYEDVVLGGGGGIGIRNRRARVVAVRMRHASNVVPSGGGYAAGDQAPAVVVDLAYRSTGIGDNYDTPVTETVEPTRNYLSADPVVRAEATAQALKYQDTLTKTGTVRKRETKP